MSVQLPASPYPVLWTPEPVSLATDLKSAVGRTVQRIFRPGDGWAITLFYHKARMDACGRAWASKVLLATKSTAVWTLPPPEDGLTSGGTPVVNGGGQAGTSLSVRGFLAGDVIKAFQWMSLFVGGRHYLHMVTADAVANGAGVAVLGLMPELRVALADGTAVELAAPSIEGLIPVEQAMPITRRGLIEFSGNLTITENR